MTDHVVDYFKRVEWLPPCNQIPRWHDRGVHHGFEGLNYELPPFGIHLKQIHSTTIVEVTQSGTEGLAGMGDGLATFLPSHRIAVKTADCLPILIKHHDCVMALHAGWRGLAGDIIGEANKFLQAKGLRIEDCEFGIGPCISSQSFEIGPEVVEAFGSQAVYEDILNWALAKGVWDRWHLDLAALAVLRLMKAGAIPSHISVIRTDTKTHPEQWHSFRREGEHVGRNWTWIEHNAV